VYFGPLAWALWELVALPQTSFLYLRGDKRGVREKNGSNRGGAITGDVGRDGGPKRKGIGIQLT